MFAKIIVKDERLTGDDVNEVLAEKQQMIRKNGLANITRPANALKTSAACA